MKSSLSQLDSKVQPFDQVSIFKEVNLYEYSPTSFTFMKVNERLTTQSPTENFGEFTHDTNQNNPPIKTAAPITITIGTQQSHED